MVAAIPGKSASRRGKRGRDPRPAPNEALPWETPKSSTTSGDSAVLSSLPTSLSPAGCPCERPTSRESPAEAARAIRPGPHGPGGGTMLSRGTRRCGLLAVLLAGLAPVPTAAAATPTTPAGWALTPAGRVTTITDGPGLSGPWAASIAPDGKSVVVTSSGTAARFESVERFDTGSLMRTGLAAYDGNAGQSVFYGLAYSPDGTHAYASGGGKGVAQILNVRPSGRVEPARIQAWSFPAGLAYARTPLGDRIYVADDLAGPPFTTGAYEDPPGSTVKVIDPATRQV